MKRSPVGHALRFLNRLSTSPTLDKWGLRNKTEEMIYQGVKTSVRAGAAAQSKFKPLKKLLPGDRLKVSSKPPVFFFCTSFSIPCSTNHFKF